MISTLRNQKKITTFVLWFIIAAFVGTIFFVWGVGDKVSKQNFALKVDGVVISDQDFQQKVETNRENFRRLFGNNADSLLKEGTIEKTVMDQIISETLLKNEALKLKVPVSNAEIAAAVQSIEAFQNNGQFDMQRYTDLLARNRLTPKLFEESIKNDITVQKMQDLIKKSVSVTDQELKNEYNYRNTSAVVNYIELNADEFASSVNVDDAAVKKFYDENKTAYRIPERANFKVLIFDPAQFKPQINISDKEVEAYYIKNKSTADTPEKVKASHILFKVNDWKNEKDAYDKAVLAKKVLAEIKAGADFAEEAKKYSDDGSAKDGGDLGYFTKGQMVVPFETVAFKLKPGEVSDVVRTQFGYHIIKVIDHVAGGGPETLEQAKPKIIETLTKEKADAEFRNAVYDKYKEIVTASNLTAYNQKHNNELPLAEIKNVTESGAGTPLAGKTDITKKIMRLNKTEISELIDSGAQKFIFEMTDKYDAYIPKYEDIKDIVKKDYIAKKSLEAAVNKAKEYAKLPGMSEVSAQSGKTFVTPAAFTRTEPINGIGMNEKLMTSIFLSKPGTFIAKPYTIGKKVFLVEVQSLTAPDMKNFAQQKDALTSALIGTKSEAALKDYIAALKKKAVIEVSDRYKAYYTK